jgi:hypothetical protein
VENALHRVEAATGKHFGDGENPLLVSVRSGAAVSMPGMMETILNLGLNDVTVEGLTRQSRNPQFAWDSYRRFVQMYGSVVFDLSRKPFEQILEEHRQRCKVERDIDLSVDEPRPSCANSNSTCGDGEGVPEDPLDQLWGAIAAVFESWNTRRAIDYRKLHDIPDSMGIAVNVVAMVFGNLGEDSVPAWPSPRPSTGAQALYGEYLLNAQGEDVVSGSRTPLPIATLKDRLLPRTRSRAGRAYPGAALSGRMESPSSAAPSTCCDAARQARGTPPPDRVRDGGRGPHFRGGGCRADSTSRFQSAPAPHDRSDQPLDLLTTDFPPARRDAAPSCSTPTVPRSWAAPARP